MNAGCEQKNCSDAGIYDLIFEWLGRNIRLEAD